MKKAIWGAGVNGGRLAASIGSDKFDFFIDKDETKSNTKYFGKSVINPSTIKDRDWEDIYVFVPHNFYDEISDYLIGKGLSEGKDFEKFSNSIEISMKNASKNLESYLERVREEGDWSDRVVIWGVTWFKFGYTESYLDFQSKGNKIAVISEAIWLSEGETRRALRCPVLISPMIGDDYTIVCAGRENGEVRKCIEKKPYLKYAVDQLHDMFRDNDIKDCENTVYLMYRYILDSLDYLNIKKIICHDSVGVRHRILREVCEERRIDIIFTHPGCLPGTNSFDYGGEVGESLVALKEDEFLRLPCNEDDIYVANEVCDFLYKSKINRKKQPGEGISDIIDEQLNYKSRPIIFFAGQNDAMSYMVPYMERVRKYHSPVFRTSTEAAIFIAEVCKKNEWNFVYKPHPVYVHPEQIKQLPKNTIFIETGNINEVIDMCDLTITILSSTNYVALIRKKPVVMLGYNQIKGKGCCYETYEKEKIEDTIKEALEKGFTKEQRANFTKHVAQLLKYYLYDDMLPRELRYGKQIPRSFEDFYELKHLLGG